jgi:hypothetical protein
MRALEGKKRPRCAKQQNFYLADTKKYPMQCKWVKICEQRLPCCGLLPHATTAFRFFGAITFMLIFTDTRYIIPNQT